MEQYITRSILMFFLNSENKKKIKISAGPKKWNVKNDKANP